jgi:signal-transduction protein with cAMP-binding, CBS, and nucleotidyltransferase domain
MKTGIKVIEAMTRSPVIVNPNEKIITCVKKMMKKDVGSLIIAENGKLLGIATEKDFVNRVIAKNLNINEIKINKIMSTKLIKISPYLDLYDAILFMSREEVRRLPVVEKDKFIGLLTYKDILKIQPDLYDIFIEKFKIREEKNKLL